MYIIEARVPLIQIMWEDVNYRMQIEHRQPNYPNLEDGSFCLKVMIHVYSKEEIHKIIRY